MASLFHLHSTGPKGCRRLFALAVSLTACGSYDGEKNQLESGYSFYALVRTIDGTSFGPPLGPPVVATGQFDPTLLGRLGVVLEAEDGAGRVSTLGAFSSTTRPGLVLLGEHDLYWMNVPAATYFTDPALSYRFRALLDGREIGRSDMSSRIFEVMSYVPTVPVGVKLRIEARAAPVLTSISPAIVGVGASDLVLSVTGASFAGDSFVRLGGQDLLTTRLSSTELAARVPATLLGSAGDSAVTVVTPAPGGGTSAAQALVVQNPAPSLASLEPASAQVASPDAVLTLIGEAFVPGAVASFAGVNLPTTFVSPTELTATLGASLLASAGTFDVVVANPAPAAAASSVLAFTVCGANTRASGGVCVADAAPFPLDTLGDPAVSCVHGEWACVSVRPEGAGVQCVGPMIYDVCHTPVGSPYFSTVIAGRPHRGFGVWGGSSNVATVTYPASVTVSNIWVNLWNDVAEDVRDFRLSYWDGAAWVLAVSGTRTNANFGMQAFPFAPVTSSRFRLEVLGGYYSAYQSGAVVVLSAEAPNPVPSLTSVSPANVLVGTGDTRITVAGSSFVASSVVRLGATDLATTWVSATSLVATVPAALLTTAGDRQITVFTPGPGGGASETRTLRVIEAGYVLISGGTFIMGSPTTETGRSTNETQHVVTLTRNFAIKSTEVTQGEWRAVMGTNPSVNVACGDSCPVERVSWNQAIGYLNALSDRAGLARCYTGSSGNWSFVGLDCAGYRLPTEAEWEYAARAGSTGPNGPEGTLLGSVAWYSGNTTTIHAVGLKQPNAWGLYDVFGNAWEWVEDWYASYPAGPLTDPVGPATGTIRVMRGGNYYCGANYCRSASRYAFDPNGVGGYIGFRTARTLP